MKRCVLITRSFRSVLRISEWKLLIPNCVTHRSLFFRTRLRISIAGLDGLRRPSLIPLRRSTQERCFLVAWIQKYDLGTDFGTRAHLIGLSYAPLLDHCFVSFFYFEAVISRVMVYTDPIMVIRPSCILIYNRITQTKESKIRAMMRNSFDSYEDYAAWKADQVNKNKYTGVLSPSAARNLKYRIQLLVAQAKWKENINPSNGKTFRWLINFCTLTLSAPQRDVSDKTIKKEMFEPWLRIMRKSFRLRSYVWRAERQFNGNIHFHVTTDSWLNFADIQTNWNNQQSKFHFIDEFRERNSTPWPNSTDVHSTQKIKDLANYMVKYMGKNAEDHLKEINAKAKKEGRPLIDPSKHPWRSIKGQPKWNDPIEGRVWDCSKNLKTKEKVAYEFRPATYEYVNALKKKYQCLNAGDGICELLLVPPEDYRKVLPSNYYRDYRVFLEKIYSNADR